MICRKQEITTGLGSRRVRSVSGQAVCAPGRRPDNGNKRRPGRSCAWYGVLEGVEPVHGDMVEQAGPVVEATEAIAWTPPTWEAVVRDHSARVYRLAYRLT